MQQRHEARCNLHLIDSIISNNLEVFLKKDRHLETVSQNNVETGGRKQRLECFITSNISSFGDN